MNPIINIERLKALGYRIENMGEKWPRAHAGEYRWLHRDGDVQHHNVRAHSEYEAWACADADARMKADKAAIRKTQPMTAEDVARFPMAA